MDLSLRAASAPGRWRLRGAQHGAGAFHARGGPRFLALERGQSSVSREGLALTAVYVGRQEVPVELARSALRAVTLRGCLCCSAPKCASGDSADIFLPACGPLRN